MKSFRICPLTTTKSDGSNPARPTRKNTGLRHAPEPIAEKQFKGRFPLRLPGDLRRKLELEAKRKGVSLNQLILQRIA